MVKDIVIITWGGHSWTERRVFAFINAFGKTVDIKIKMKRQHLRNIVQIAEKVNRRPYRTPTIFGCEIIEED